MRTLFITALLGAAVLSAPASAAVTFKLKDFVFRGGGEATGTFTTDDSFATVTKFAITTTQADNGFGGYSYGSGAMGTAMRNDNNIFFMNDIGATLAIYFSPLMRDGADVPFAVEFIGGTGRGTDRASLVNAAVPEPMTWVMMIGGFGAIGGALRARRKTRAIARFA